MKTSISILGEQIKNLKLITSLGLFELKTKYAGNYLGLLWIFINPLLQIGVYWFAFGIGLKSGQPIGDIPYVYWITVGLIVWFYINGSLSIGAGSIYTRINIISKMNFPVSIIPTFIVFSQLIEHLILLLGTLLVFNLVGLPLNIHYLELPYYLICTTAMVVSFNILLATLATFIRDVKLLVASALKFGMFLSPILWSPDHLSVGLQFLIKLNPVYYLINGYRTAIFGEGKWFYEQPLYALYFWVLVIIVFIIGANANKRMRENLLDYL